LLPGGANQFPGGTFPLWTSAFHGARTYLNNVIEQDHPLVKKRVWLANGYGSFQSAWRTLQGIETVHMIRKARVRCLSNDDALGQALFIRDLFGIAASPSLSANRLYERRQVIAERQPVQFEESVPSRARHQPDLLAAVERRPA
jgi:hypothetical protein